MSLKDKANERKRKQKERMAQLHEEQKLYRDYVRLRSQAGKPALRKRHLFGN